MPCLDLDLGPAHIRRGAAAIYQVKPRFAIKPWAQTNALDADAYVCTDTDIYYAVPSRRGGRASILSWLLYSYRNARAYSFMGPTRNSLGIIDDDLHAACSSATPDLEVNRPPSTCGEALVDRSGNSGETLYDG
jgi:hypothetical protein